MIQTVFGQAPSPSCDPRPQLIYRGTGSGRCSIAASSPVSLLYLVDINADIARLLLPPIFSTVLSTGR